MSAPSRAGEQCGHNMLKNVLSGSKPSQNGLHEVIDFTTSNRRDELATARLQNLLFFVEDGHKPLLVRRLPAIECYSIY